MSGIEGVIIFLVLAAKKQWKNLAERVIGDSRVALHVLSLRRALARCATAGGEAFVALWLQWLVVLPTLHQCIERIYQRSAQSTPAQYRNMDLYNCHVLLYLSVPCCSLFSRQLSSLCWLLRDSDSLHQPPRWQVASPREQSFSILSWS